MQGLPHGVQVPCRWHVHGQGPQIMPAKRGLYSNIAASGSGEKMRKAGSKGAPSAKAFKQSAKTAKKRGK